MLNKKENILSNLESPLLFLVDERLKTFKKWPFSDKEKCNIRNMAEAGFYSVATGDEDVDAAKCFLCGKELDGWEASDDPWAEHKSHAAMCAFVQLGKKEDDLLLSEFVSVVKQYVINDRKRVAKLACEQIDEKARLLKRQLKRK
ncbi:baculoviral IAP repeat-containing protein 5 [Maniola hyperantus]|uniref:baculoviral IAP repeat-containing protein 5 n=1 Tax=Aphantopus hyperantus TaxID=2795564 RepID=UPI001567F3F6|nr:baculoviral IAP repeat-containing protein 5 [Maniola hyperantus]